MKFLIFQMLRFVVLSACMIAASVARPQAGLPAAVVPAGVSAAACPNYPLCNLAPEQPAAVDLSIFTPAQQVNTIFHVI